MTRTKRIALLFGPIPLTTLFNSKSNSRNECLIWPYSLLCLCLVPFYSDLSAIEPVSFTLWENAKRSFHAGAHLQKREIFSREVEGERIVVVMQWALEIILKCPINNGMDLRNVNFSTYHFCSLIVFILFSLPVLSRLDRIIEREARRICPNPIASSICFDQ